jgi:hypothetical protein
VLGVRNAARACVCPACARFLESAFLTGENSCVLAPGGEIGGPAFRHFQVRASDAALLRPSLRAGPRGVPWLLERQL